MKAIIILSLIALACAVPVDEKKTPQKPLAPANTPSKPVQAPPKTADVQFSRTKRDTQKQAAPQPTVNAQKNASPTISNAPKVAADTPKNTRTNRDTQKATPIAAPQLKKTETAQKPVAASAPVPTQNSRKTRELPKQAAATDAPKQALPAQTTNTQKAATPQVARVPLTSTNLRNRRDAPKPAEQSKIVPTATNVKSDNSATVKASNTPAAASTIIKPKRDTVVPQSSNGPVPIHRPVPVDQVLKQKAAAPAPEAPKVTDQKPVVKS